MRGVELKYVRNAHAAGGCTHARLKGVSGDYFTSTFVVLGALAAEVEARARGALTFRPERLGIPRVGLSRGLPASTSHAVDDFVIFDDVAELSPFLVELVSLGSQQAPPGLPSDGPTCEHAPAYLRGKGLRNRHLVSLQLLNTLTPKGGSAQGIYTSVSPVLAKELLWNPASSVGECNFFQIIHIAGSLCRGYRLRGLYACSAMVMLLMSRFFKGVHVFADKIEIGIGKPSFNSEACSRPWDLPQL